MKPIRRRFALGPTPFALLLLWLVAGMESVSAAPRLGGSDSGSARELSNDSSLRGRGWKAHQAGDNTRAERLLGQSLQADPSDAKAWWLLALVLEDMERPAQALQALQNARRADPALSFAANPAGVQAKERILTRKAGAGVAKAGAGAADANARNGGRARNDMPAPRNGAPNGSAATSGAPFVGVPSAPLSSALPGALQGPEVARALQNSGVYVSPAMRDVAAPTQIVAALRGVALHGLRASVVVLSSLPRSVSSVEHLAQATHEYLKLGDAGFVVSVVGQSVAVYGAGLDEETLQNIAQSSAKTFDSEGYAAGVAQIARLVAGERARSDAQGRTTLLVLLGVPAALFLWGRHRGKQRRAARLSQSREAARVLSNTLAPQFETIDADYEYALLSETEPARQAQLQQERTRIGESFVRAMKLLGDAQSADEFDRAVAALRVTQTEMQSARDVLQSRSPHTVAPPAPASAPASDASANGLSPGGAPVNHAAPNNGQADSATPSTETIEVPPLGSGLNGALPDYALDFFTSQPVPRAQMVPVDLEVDGQKRRVWASRQSARNALNGEPQIAIVPCEGGQRAWFDVPQYNPWQSSGTQVLQMMSINTLLNSMSDHSYLFGSGYSGDNGSNNSDNRMNEAGHDADAASLDSPLNGDWPASAFDSRTADADGAAADGAASSASLDVLGSDATSGSDASQGINL